MDGRQNQQSAQERREHRKKCKDMSAKAVREKEALCSGLGTKLQEMLTDLDKLQEKAVKPREHAADAEVFCMLTEAGYQAAKKLGQGDQGRGLPEFLNDIMFNHITVDIDVDYTVAAEEDPNVFEWSLLGSKASAFFRLAPGVSCMLGAMDVEHKVRKVAQRQAKRPLGQVVRPEELDEIVEEEKQETDRNMEEMWGILQVAEGGQCPVADLVCNFNCFAQTVENIFTLSFLVRDGKVRLFSEEENGMMAKTVTKAETAAQAARGADEQSQFIMDFKMSDWAVMKQIVPASDCKMKHRKEQVVKEDKGGKRKSMKQEGGAGPSNA